MSVAIDTEPFSDELAQEMLPLGRKCWEESTLVKGATCAYYGDREFVPDPDTEAYARMDGLGMVVIVTLRFQGALKGYVIGLTYKSTHHRNITCAMGDSIYIEPAFRAYTAVVADKFEQALKSKGVEIIGWPVHIDGPVYGVLKARGYVGDDIVMEKRLCASQQPS